MVVRLELIDGVVCMHMRYGEFQDIHCCHLPGLLSTVLLLAGGLLFNRAARQSV